ncbi:MAG: ATP-binding protein [Chloroflexia bacterium]|nr:ATP-binding protein [Chloroflexia bacterium]
MDLSLALGTDATELWGNAHALRRILDNLVSNALAATPTGGMIVVELWSDRAYPEHLTIAVRDSGSGLTPDEQQQIFLPRPQPHAGPGMGVGLAIVADVTAQLGGAWGVTSHPGAGSTFWVRLPRAPKETGR